MSHIILLLQSSAMTVININYWCIHGPGQKEVSILKWYWMLWILMDSFHMKVPEIVIIVECHHQAGECYMS